MQIAAQTNLLIQQNAQNHQQATGAAPGYQQPRAQPVFEEAFFSSAANAEMINGLASGLAQQFMQGRGAGSDAMAAMARTLAQSFAESAAQVGHTGCGYIAAYSKNLQRLTNWQWYGGVCCVIITLTFTLTRL